MILNRVLKRVQSFRLLRLPHFFLCCFKLHWTKEYFLKNGNMHMFPQFIKKGDRSLPVNYYRPVSLTCTCKVLEHIQLSILNLMAFCLKPSMVLESITLTFLSRWKLCMILLMHLTRANSLML